MLAARAEVARSMQARAVLASGVSQQALKHVTGVWVISVIAARVTPISKIPIEGAGPYGYKPEPIEPSAEVMACARLELFAFVKS